MLMCLGRRRKTAKTLQYDGGSEWHGDDNSRQEFCVWLVFPPGLCRRRCLPTRAYFGKGGPGTGHSSHRLPRIAVSVYWSVKGVLTVDSSSPRVRRQPNN